MRSKATWSVLATLAAAVGAASAAERPKCALADGLIVLKADAKAGTVTVSRADKQLVLKAAPGSEVAIDLARLGLPAGKGTRYVGWNSIGGTFIPPFTSPLKITLGTGAVQKVNVRKLESHPQLVSAMGGCLSVEWDAAKRVLRGVARVAADTPLQLRITAPPTPKAWRLEAADVAKADWAAGVVPEPWQSGPWAGVILRSPAARDVAWTVYFKTKGRGSEGAAVTYLRASALSHKRIEVRWGGDAGYYLLQRNDQPPIGLFDERYLDKDVMPNTPYTYTVAALSWAGRSKAQASVTVTTPQGPPPLPKPDVFLSDLTPLKATVGWNDHPRKDKSIEDNPLRIAGEEYARGMGVHALSELVYALKPTYARFVSYIGVDDEKGGAGTCTFEVYADGKRLYASGKMSGRQEAKEINLALPKGAKRLRLVVGDAGDGIGCDHADWARAGFVVKKK